MYEPGKQTYHHMPADEYHGIRAVSSTVLKAAHLDGWTAAKHVIAGDRELDSRNVVIGSAVAAFVEKKALFCSTYMEAPRDYKTATSQKFLAYTQENGIDAKHLLTETEWSTVVRVGTAVKESICMYRPNDTLYSEPSFFWTEGDTLCKCRPDVFIEGPSTPDPDYIEIKTAASVSPHAVRSAFFRYGYHIQQAWYERGISTAFHKLPRVTFLFVSTTPPHDVRFYRLSDFDAVESTLLVTDLLGEYQRRAASNNWSDDSITAPTIIQMGLGKNIELEGTDNAE